MSLQSRIRNSALNGKMRGVEAHAKDILRFWQTHAPHFTDHGVTHSENIISSLARIIPSNVFEKMDEYEIFLLLCGAWLHDTGMLVKKKGEDDKQVRAFHHERGRELIRKS